MKWHEIKCNAMQCMNELMKWMIMNGWMKWMNVNEWMHEWRKRKEKEGRKEGRNEWRNEWFQWCVGFDCWAQQFFPKFILSHIPGPAQNGIETRPKKWRRTPQNTMARRHPPYVSNLETVNSADCSDHKTSISATAETTAAPQSRRQTHRMPYRPDNLERNS